ncbi:MAG: hypothetical protein SVR94_02525 [Pseudomonadota bacterium]|nr:hypothetical protein [Pseudomonadota bacterium]
MMKKKIVCASPYFKKETKWLSPAFPEYDWNFCYPIAPKLRRYINHNNYDRLNRLMQAIQVIGASYAPSVELILLFDEALTFWTATLLSRVNGRKKPPVVCFSMNYHTLPTGLKYRLMRKAFQQVDLFVVHSKFDKYRYANYFDLDPGKIEVMLWGISPSEITPLEPLVTGDYICALGENARDYKTLIEAMWKLPDIRLELVVKPYNLANLSIPPNVNVHTNIPLSEAKNILYHSRFMVMPLNGSEVSNGHVTLALAQHLGKAMIVTDSKGISDYIIPGYNAETVPAFNVDALVHYIQLLWYNPKQCQLLGKNGKIFATNHLDDKNVEAHLKKVIERYIQTDSFYPAYQGENTNFE